MLSLLYYPPYTPSSFCTLYTYSPSLFSVVSLLNHPYVIYVDYVEYVIYAVMLNTCPLVIHFFFLEGIYVQHNNITNIINIINITNIHIVHVVLDIINGNHCVIDHRSLNNITISRHFPRLRGNYVAGNKKGQHAIYMPPSLLVLVVWLLVYSSSVFQ